MSENNKLEQKYKDMIRKMATRAGSVVSDSYVVCKKHSC